MEFAVHAAAKIGNTRFLGGILWTDYFHHLGVIEKR